MDATSLARPRLRPWLAVRPVTFFLPLLFFLVPLLFVPLVEDEAVYAVVAREMLDGAVPYRDVFDHKPPLIYAWYALSFLLFGESEYAPRVMAALTLCGTAACFFVVARHLVYERRAYLLTALFGLSTGAVGLAINANTEVFTLLPAMASLALMVEPTRRRDWRLTLLAGVLAGAAIWTRPTVLFACMGVGVWLLLEARQRADGRPVASYIAGAAATVPVVLLPFALTGALDDLWYANVTYQGFYFGEPDGHRWLGFTADAGKALLGIGPLVAAAYFGLSRTVRSGHWRRTSPVFVLWSAGALVGQFVTGRYLSHYLVLMLPTLLVMAGPMVDMPRWWWARRPRLVWALAAASAAALLVNLTAYADLRSGAHRTQEAEATGRSLAVATCPGDEIWEFGRSSLTYFYSGRSAPTRFIYDRPFWLDHSTMQEAMSDLRSDPPAVIVDMVRHEAPIPDQGIFSAVGNYYYPVGVARLLRDRYVMVGADPAPIYRLRGAASWCALFAVTGHEARVGPAPR